MAELDLEGLIDGITSMKDAYTEDSSLSSIEKSKGFSDLKKVYGEDLKLTNNIVPGGLTDTSVSLDGGKTYFKPSEFCDSIQKGDIETSLKKSGFTEEELSKPEVKEQIKNIDEKNKQSASNQAVQQIQESVPPIEQAKNVDIPENVKKINDLPPDKQADALRDELKKNTEETKKLRDQIEQSNKDLQKLKDDIKSGKEPSGSFWDKALKALKFFLTLGAISALIYLAVDFIDFCDKAKDAINGCWSIDKNGNKCKIDVLTCNDNCLNTQVDASFLGWSPGDLVFSICSPCQDNVKSCTNGQWIPTRVGQTCPCNSSDTRYFRSYNPYAASGVQPASGDCFNSSNGTCPIQSGTGVNANQRTGALATQRNLNYQLPYSIENFTYPPADNNYGKQTDVACPYYSGCIVSADACNPSNKSNSSCSTWCDSKYVNTLDGQRLVCKNASLLDMVGSLLPGVFNTDFMSKLEKILFIIACSLIGAAVLYIVIKEIWIYVDRKAYEESSKEAMEEAMEEAKEHSDIIAQLTEESRINLEEAKKHKEELDKKQEEIEKRTQKIKEKLNNQ